MNWGNKIILAFVLFAIFILYMVVRAFQQDAVLVAEDYYVQEINYQKKLERMANLRRTGARAMVDQKETSIVVTFPRQHQVDGGEIYFYHLSQKIFDTKLPIAIEKENQQVIDKNLLVPGLYHINLLWRVDNEEFFQQEPVYIR